MPVIYFSHLGIAFRPVEESDLDNIRDLRNYESTWTNLTDPRPISAGGQAAWLQSLGQKSGKFYFIALDDENPFIGMVRMDEYDMQNRSIRVGADVVPSLRGKGFGTRIYEAIKKYCFDEMNCHRVWLQVLQTNAVGKRLYSSAGFQYEGILRQAVFRNGSYVDYCLMSILESEYRK
jgi:UDP-4-amino-4,6-dideoxy-N-acetyl-beta-L-altrosamine N-acetyltransferase